MKLLSFMRKNSVVLLTLIMCALLISLVVINKTQATVVTMEQLILAKSVRVSEVIRNLVVYRSHTLAALVLQSEDISKELNNIAPAIVEDPSILRVGVAPDATVKYLYPLEGNEELLGRNLLGGEGVGVFESRRAMELGETVLGGPFNVVGGGQGLIVRTPVYTYGENGEKEFWGLISLVLAYPQVMDVIGLDELQLQGYAYKIYNVNSDSGERQLIGSSDYDFDANSRYIEKKVTILNSDWFFRIYSINKWYTDADLPLLVAAGLILVFFVSRTQRMSVKANEASKAKSGFLASMSHEIRTPMNAIIGMSELLLNETLSERQREYVNDIIISSTSLLGIINDILDVSKIEEGKLALAPANFNLPQLIDNIHTIILFTARNKNLEFALEQEGQLPDVVYGDDVRVRQILINLLGNAVKFTDEGVVKLNVSYSEGNAHFVVSDTGIGIKESNIARLYDSFEQFDSKKNRGKQGTGLGLAITKNLVDMMNGNIRVHSLYGEGTTFHVDLPLPIGDEAQAGNNAYTDEAEFVSAKDAKVLLVDDNEINRKVAEGLLRLSDIVCDTAANGIEAIQKVQEKKYDIVFMDHMMPEMDGIEAASKIREMGGKYKQGELVIIALTANILPEARKLFAASGMDDFLAKPIEKALLNKILMKWIPKDKQVKKKLDVSLAVSETEYSPALREAQAIGGLDVAMGLSRVSGMTDYERSLRLLSESVPGFNSELEIFLNREELDRFAINIHGMKGALAINGHVGLSEMAQKLETEAKNNNIEFCREQFPVFSEQLRLFGSALDKIFSNREMKQKLDGGNEILIKALGNIEEYISRYDRDNALKELEGISDYTFGSDIDKTLEQLTGLLENFDLDLAIELIHNINL